MRRALLMLVAALLIVVSPAQAEQIPYEFAGEDETSSAVSSAFVTEYVVKEGDSLAAIARSSGADWPMIAAMNNLASPELLHPGQHLFLPVLQQDCLVVKPGDTLWAIAEKFQVTVEDLAFENGIRDMDRLQAGQHLTVPGLPVIPTFLEGRAAQTLARGTASLTLLWPVAGAVTSAFGWRGDEYHHGVDIGAGTGSLIRAAAPGKVEFAGWKNAIYGNVVIINHGRKYKTLYAHNQANLVAEGEPVAAGQPVAEVGSSGRTTGPHLHFEVYRDENPVDPMPLLPQ